MNKTIIFKTRPSGKPSLKDFEILEQSMPVAGENEMLLKTRYVSVDPYLRGRMRDEKSYIEPFKLNEPLESGIIAEVLESNNSNFKKGDFVTGMLKWQKYQSVSGVGLNKVDPKLPLTVYLGVLGLTGITAYLGLEKIGRLNSGETLLVSGAAGAVGSVAGQIGKIKGCRVIGIAGSDEKIDNIKNTFGFDEGINYKTTENLRKEIREKCPQGIDVYFDNVGGDILDAALANMNKFGRVINCGAISLYNESEMPKGPRPEGLLIKKSLLMQGFTVRDYVKDFGPARNKLATWLQEEKITYNETIVEGFENIPQAFIDLFDGKNEGKMIVKI
ncbi:NADP-dependent oxidoreductase [soil metagenome]